MVVLSNNAVNEFVKPLSLSLLCALEEKQQTVEFTESVLAETGTLSRLASNVPIVGSLLAM